MLGESDAAAWWQLRLEALDSEPFAFGKAVEEHRNTPEMIAIRLRDSWLENFTLGAFDTDGGIVGNVTFVREAGLKERHKGRIYAVYVALAWRHRGTGRALIASRRNVFRALVADIE